ncbi:MAG: radical SAM-associated putative lipoprotein [Bacteroidia bacterium]|nr:radical SAM-associated putative lipoprotein [Bacteroidia bacterium]
MKKIALNTYTKIIAWLLSVLGLNAGCGDTFEPRAEYGVPSADFRAKGTITDAKTNKPIQNIRVIGKPEYGYESDTAFTDENGNYSVEMKGIIGFPVKIYAEDVDGALNGWYNPDSLQVEQRDTRQVKKGNGWHSGVFEKNDANFILEHRIVVEYGVPAATYKKIEEQK